MADILLTDEELDDLGYPILPLGDRTGSRRVAQAQIKKFLEWLKIRASFHSDDHMAYMRLSWNEWRELEEIGSA